MMCWAMMVWAKNDKEKLMKMIGVAQSQMGLKVGLKWALDIWTQK